MGTWKYAATNQQQLQGISYFEISCAGLYKKDRVKNLAIVFAVWHVLDEFITFKRYENFDMQSRGSDTS